MPHAPCETKRNVAPFGPFRTIIEDFGAGGSMTAQDDQTKSAQLVTRLERLPFSDWHRNFFILAFWGIAFDAMDFALFGAALPPVAREFGLGPAQSGLLATVGLIGAFLGALF